MGAVIFVTMAVVGAQYANYTYGGYKEFSRGIGLLLASVVVMIIFTPLAFFGSILAVLHVGLYSLSMGGGLPYTIPLYVRSLGRHLLLTAVFAIIGPALLNVEDRSYLLASLVTAPVIVITIDLIRQNIAKKKHGDVSWSAYWERRKAELEKVRAEQKRHDEWTASQNKLSAKDRIVAKKSREALDEFHKDWFRDDN